MEKPKYFDATDGTAVIVQRPQLERVTKAAYWHGFEVAALPGLIGMAIATLLALVTAPSFNDMFGLEGAVWKAFFILVASLCSLLAVVVGVRLFLSKQPNLEEFFEGNKKIK